VNSNTRSLLIIACSQRKCLTPGLLPALERYDGGSYRLLRKARREDNWPKRLDVLILSAKYGLIEASTPIAHYEQRMTRQRAIELHPQTLQVLQSYAEQNIFHEVYVDLGQDYAFAIRGIEQLFSKPSVTFAAGRIGERLSHLKTWLIERCKEP
jgi:hypothetical protein